ncbi:MAG: hypothetical protein IT370_06555 [Deltaproteobacteria bacterium]|nr:hypothetical protein [Deltaproteobacteria bacterium]
MSAETHRTPLPDELVQRYLDGEVSADERVAVEARLGEDAETRRRVEAGRELGSRVRAYSARALEEAEAAGSFEAMLEGIQARIGREGTGASVGAVRARENGAARSRSGDVHALRGAGATGGGRGGRRLWAIAGALAIAAAVVVFLIVRRPRRGGEVAQPTKPSPSAPAPSVSESPSPVEMAVAGVSNEASIESIDVPGTASIFTIPDETGDGATTVIWLSASADDAGQDGSQ